MMNLKLQHPGCFDLNSNLKNVCSTIDLIVVWRAPRITWYMTSRKKSKARQIRVKGKLKNQSGNIWCQNIRTFFFLSGKKWQNHTHKKKIL